ncbi:DNA polymerase III subunit delta [Paenibacillus sp. GSMTC-2017]|uniref:DNA polymerase III subunit delta n=1 Tax=Paenibacillus sp. GSMTC-2017 TaxID=2794350 RepID=UPI0018D64B03|nr:DNA polymerase III subunit delta [Paenibacillus sp. GSMTC-2017]MBH5318162.1 DNA polymerase III subunit delta [Paenibacillus sp. GSMTC-2017]
MDIKEALKEIKSGKYRPIYVLYGKDRYRMSQFIEALTNEMFTPEEKEMGVTKFDTSETSIDEAVLEAETPSFFLNRKLILIRDTSVMAAGGKENAKIEHRPETLMNYINSPLDTSVIVFAVHADKLDERRKLVKTLKDRNSIVAFPELDGPALKRWMIKRAADQNRQMTDDAADLLLVRVGVNMGQLSQEVDKLCLHAGAGGIINAEQATLLTEATVEEDVFALVDSIAELQIDRALKLYHQLLTRREEPIKIVALIARQLRIMLQIKELEGHHYSPQQMAGQLGLHPYAVKLSAEKSRKFTPARLGVLLASLAELDYKMKTGVIEKTLGLELYLLSLGIGKGA